MLRLKALTKLVRPVQQHGIYRVPTLSYSSSKMIEDHKTTRIDDGVSEDCLKEKPMRWYIEKEAERTGKPQKEQSMSRKVKNSFLVSTLLDLDNSKEAVYGALDAWVAPEQEFPIGRLKAALIDLEKKQQWHRVVQVIKWMLSKGHGVTIATYAQLIRALDMDHRVEEANKVWVIKLGRDMHSVPWKICDIMISVYYRNDMMEELVKLFKRLEAHGRKPPEKSIVQKVADSYERLGLLEEKELVLEKYKSLFTKGQGKHGRYPRRKAAKGAGTQPSSKSDDHHNDDVESC